MSQFSKLFTFFIFVGMVDRRRSGRDRTFQSPSPSAHGKGPSSSHLSGPPPTPTPRHGREGWLDERFILQCHNVRSKEGLGYVGPTPPPLSGPLAPLCPSPLGRPLGATSGGDLSEGRKD